MASAATIQPKGKGQLSSDRVQNPHDPEATGKIGAACNVKRWIRREIWKLQQAACALTAEASSLPAA
jgi:hypothetical protein